MRTNLSFRSTLSATRHAARVLALALAMLPSLSAHAALPGAVEFRVAPEALHEDDLAALLDARVRKAEVVALGESVHGSSAMLRIQTRLVRYLVERHGMRLILWENPTLRSQELAQWLASCARATSPPPLEVLYMPTPSDRPLWEWACRFNHAHPADPLRFRGIDIWDRPWEHYARVRKLAAGAGIAPALPETIANRCPAHGATSWQEFDSIFVRVQAQRGFAPQTDYVACRTALSRVLDAATAAAREQMKQKHESAADSYELALSVSTLLGWLGFYHYNWTDDILSWNARDEAQGRNIMLAMEQHGLDRAIVAAHTSHVSHNRSAADWWGFGDIKSGIYFYTKLTGRRVFNIAFTAYDASGPQGHFSAPTATNSLDRRLHHAGHRFAFVPADAAFLKEHPRWWIQNQNFPGPYESGVELVLADHFDAYFFFDRSLLDEALPARPVWQP